MRQAILENLKSLVGLLVLLLVCGLFAWTLNGARSARAEAYGVLRLKNLGGGGHCAERKADNGAYGYPIAEN